MMSHEAIEPLVTDRTRLIIPVHFAGAPADLDPIYDLAARRKIPAVCDEGGYFLPPLGSKFELTRPGTDIFDLQTDLAIKHGYWGMMPTTYCGPEDPIWQDAKWLRTINGRFQAGRILGM